MNDEYEKLPWVEKHFDERQSKEIEFNSTYAIKFYHGTGGHNARMIIAKLTGLLSEIHYAIGGPFPDIDEVKKIMGQKNEL